MSKEWKNGHDRWSVDELNEEVMFLKREQRMSLHVGNWVDLAKDADTRMRDGRYANEGRVLGFAFLGKNGYRVSVAARRLDKRSPSAKAVEYGSIWVRPGCILGTF